MAVLAQDCKSSEACGVETMAVLVQDCKSSEAGSVRQWPFLRRIANPAKHEAKQEILRNM
jgi:hypothetical protein